MLRRDFLRVTSAAGLATVLPLPPPLHAAPARSLPPGAVPHSLPAPWQGQAPGQRPAPPAPPRHDRYLWTLRAGYPVRF